MKEIRHYIKRVNDFPVYQGDLNTISAHSLWNDVMIRTKNLIKFYDNLNVIEWDKVKKQPNLLGLHLVLCYFFADPNWKEENIDVEKLIAYLKDKLPILATNVSPYTEWISDGERSEELVRSLLNGLDLLPANETEKYFKDRLRSIDTLERIRILEESKKAQERAQELLRKIKQAEEEEAASKYNRE